MYIKHSHSTGYSRLEIAFILVLVLLVGVPAVTKYVELSRDAKEAVEEGLIAGVRAGLADYAQESRERGANKLFPSVLDHAAKGPVTGRDPFFGLVLEKGVAVEGWVKLDENQYQTPSGKQIVYYPDSGEFLLSEESNSASVQPLTQNKP